MPAARKNFTTRSGETFAKTLTWNDKAGTPIDLTGYSATFTVWDAAGTQVFQLTAGSGITLGGVAGTIDLLRQTAGLAAGCHSYRLTLTSGGGVVKDLLVGQFDLS